MIHAIRRVTIERGHDPRDFTLLGYGGGGGLFAASLAREMEIGKTIIPVNPAVFSAWGILNSDFREDVVRTTVMPTAALAVEELLEMFGDLAGAAADKLAASGLAAERARFVRALDMRYEGQEHTVRVPLPPADDFKAGGMPVLQSLFDQLHERMYAHSSPGTPTELVNLRLSAIVESGKPSILEIQRGTGDGDEALKSAVGSTSRTSAMPSPAPSTTARDSAPATRFAGRPSWRSGTPRQSCIRASVSAWMTTET